MRYFSIIIILTIRTIWQRAEALNQCEKVTRNTSVQRN